MVRAPCCEKMGLKKGPWTPEEDQVLVAHIQKYGHGNWRALPKQAGLLRCGKSCRLRWINYLRPDIKRGNFTREEEETIINFHELLGNRWSAIAARLPGRTDNEIKNVWHTHLKKRLKSNQESSQDQIQVSENSKNNNSEKKKKKLKTNTLDINSQTTVSLQQSLSNLSSYSLSESSSSITHENECCDQFYKHFESYEQQQPSTSPEHSSYSFLETMAEELITDNSSINLTEFDESFWSETFSMDNADILNHFSNPQPEFTQTFPGYDNHDDGMDFWFNVFMGTEEFPELMLQT